MPFAPGKLRSTMKRFRYELGESWKIAVAQMRSNMTRSILTALGVIIGIVAVTLMGTAIGGMRLGYACVNTEPPSTGRTVPLANATPERLREVNRLVEEKAWGAYRTDFYPTYDYKAVAEQERKKPAK